MRNRWMCLVFFLFCLIVSGLAEASDPRHPPLEKTPAAVDKDLSRLTLQDCLDIAFAGSRLRLISAESVKIAEAQYGQALSGHWPQVKFSMTEIGRANV